MRFSIICIIAVFACMSAVAAYAGQYGSPEPVAQPGKGSIGIGYGYTSGRWEPDDSLNFSEIKTMQDQFYVQGSFSPVKNWEAYIRLGGTNLRIDDMGAGVERFRDEMKPFGSIGIRGLAYNTGGFGIGPFIQASLSSKLDDSVSTPIGPVTVEFKKPWDVSGGLAFYMKHEGVSLFGGPFFYIAQADMDMSATGYSASAEYEEKGHVGGYAGVRLPLGGGFSIEAEGILRSRLSVGAVLSYSF